MNPYEAQLKRLGVAYVALIVAAQARRTLSADGSRSICSGWYFWSSCYFLACRLRGHNAGWMFSVFSVFNRLS